MKVLHAEGLLEVFNSAGVLGAADVHVARRLGSLARESSEPALLAAALAVRAVRLGSTCLELDRMRDVAVEEDSEVDVAALPWPSVEQVVDALRVSPLVVGTSFGTLVPLRLVDTDGGPLLYLDRYWRQEQAVRDLLDDRALVPPEVDLPAVSARLEELFGQAPAPDRQRVAVALAATRCRSGATASGKSRASRPLRSSTSVPGRVRARVSSTSRTDCSCRQ